MEKLINGERSTVRLSLMFSLTVCSFKSDILWLDECAEALRNCAEGFDSYLLMKQNMLPAHRKSLEEHDIFHTLIESRQRMICYAIGVITYRLVQLNKDESDDKRNLSKLNILQGSIEPRFIPSLSVETKQ